MTNGTSQGLFVVVAIVIFGIFIVLSDTLFGNQLSNGIVGIFTDSIELTESRVSNNILGTTSQDKFNFDVNEETNTATITKYLGTDVHVVIPKVLTVGSVDYVVTVIDTNAFYGPTGTNPSREPIAVELQSVVIPDSVHTIGAWAFSRNKLSAIELPDNLETLSGGAFSHNEITNVVINKKLTSISNQVFRNNKLTNVYIHNDVSSIDGLAFRYNNLEIVELPNDTVHIDSGDSPSFDNNVSIIRK